MGTFENRDQCFSNGGTACRYCRGGRGGCWRILTDFIAHLIRDITQALRHGLAFPETLYAAAEEADPAQQQVRVVAQCHDGDRLCLQQGGVTWHDPTVLLLFSCRVMQRCSCQTNKTMSNILRNSWTSVNTEANYCSSVKSCFCAAIIPGMLSVKDQKWPINKVLCQCD